MSEAPSMLESIEKTIGAKYTSNSKKTRVNTPIKIFDIVLFSRNIFIYYSSEKINWVVSLLNCANRVTPEGV